jgi:hypothetical protein
VAEPTPDLEAIRRRHAAWATAEWDQNDTYEHPDTYCSADRDRAALLALIDAAPRAATEPGLPAELAMAQAVHVAYHSWALPTLTCMTKHRVKARRLLAALLAGDAA